MRFDFSTAARILFGAGCIGEAVDAVEQYGRRVLLVTGMGGAPAEKMESDLISKGLDVIVVRVDREPTVEMVQEGAALARSWSAQVVFGFGGGSALDAAKAIAGLVTNPGPALSYLEVVGEGKPLVNPALPLLAAPTTAGTGTEVTRNAVLGVPEKKVKVSLRSAYLIPKLAAVDPDLTQSVPPAVTAATGMDALTQVLEPFVSARGNALVDGFCREGLARAGRSLLFAYRDGSNRAAREDMSYTSLMGGLALANGGLGAVHGFAAPLGGMYPAAHGALCARLLGPVVRTNYRALTKRSAGHPAIAKYHEAARLTTGGRIERVEEWADWLEALGMEMKIPSLSEQRVERGHFEEIVEKAAVASSMKANPIQLETEELMAILGQAL